MWTLYEHNTKKMKALHYSSVLQMLESLPQEVLNMQLGDFIEISTGADDVEGQYAEEVQIVKECANKPFEFSDKFGLVSSVP